MCARDKEVCATPEEALTEHRPTLCSFSVLTYIFYLLIFTLNGSTSIDMAGFPYFVMLS